MAGSYADAISGIESGGNYGLLGPVTKSGDRAYGKYQVMGANIPQWTKQYYGRSLTPQQFLSNPQAQDAVFQGKFVGEYVPKYGPEGASKAWFAGEGGMNNPNATDQLGTSVASYAKQFTNNLGPSYADISKPPLVPGTAAPPLPPPITIGSLPQSNALPSVPQVPQAQRQQLPGIAGGFSPSALMAMSQPPQMQAPQFAANPIATMAMLQQAPDTTGLQALLKNSPLVRGLLSRG